MTISTESLSPISFTKTSHGFTLLVPAAGFWRSGMLFWSLPVVFVVSLLLHVDTIALGGVGIHWPHFLIFNGCGLLAILAGLVLPIHFGFRRSELCADSDRLVLTRKSPFFSSEKSWPRHEIKDVELASALWQPKGASLEYRRYGVRLLDGEGCEIAVILEGPFPSRKQVMECMREGLFGASPEAPAHGMQARPPLT